MPVRLLLILSLLLLPHCSGPPATQSVIPQDVAPQSIERRPFDLPPGSRVRALLTRITDGDTVRVLPDGPFTETRIRLHGIDAPEHRQPFGEAARQALARHLRTPDSRILLIVRDRDRYGRTVADIVVAGRRVTVDLVREGFAWWYRRYAPDDAALRDAEAEARDNRRGLWSRPDAVPPWQWRRR